VIAVGDFGLLLSYSLMRAFACVTILFDATVEESRRAT